MTTEDDGAAGSDWSDPGDLPDDSDHTDYGGQHGEPRETGRRYPRDSGSDQRTDHRSDQRADPDHRPDLDLLVWDAPNIDMTLSNVIGGRPTPASRPRFDAVAKWLLAGAQDHEVEGCVFANVPPGGAVSMRGWIEAIRSFGYAVFARPKLGPEDDIDADMLEHIERRAHSHTLRRLVVASGDGRNFLEPLERLGRSGVDVVVLSFAEVAGYAQESDILTFLDLEDVPGAFTNPLPRVRLDNLPEGGAWLPPTRSMRSLLDDVSA